jgi:hypothetical protein
MRYLMIHWIDEAVLAQSGAIESEVEAWTAEMGRRGVRPRVTTDDVIRAASHSIRSGGPPAMAPGDRSACDHRRVPPRNPFNAPGASRRPLARWFLLPISLIASAAATQKNGTVGTT